MKKLFAISSALCLALFASSAMAAGPWNTYNLNQTINLSAQINQSATLACPGSVFFNVIDPSVATNGDQNVACTAKVSLHKGGSAFYSLSNSTLIGSESAGVIPSDLVWAKTDQSQGYAPVDNSGYYPLTYAPNSGALNHEMNMTFSFQLQPVPTMVPDIYNGTATITLQVQ